MALTFKCDDCGKDLDEVVIGPVLRDEVWHRLAVRGEMICAQCMFARAAARDVRLALADLHPCQFNLMHSPVSWFELFAFLELTPPANLDAWRAAAFGFPNAPAALTEGVTQGSVEVMTSRGGRGNQVRIEGTRAPATCSSAPSPLWPRMVPLGRATVCSVAPLRKTKGTSRPATS